MSSADIAILLERPSMSILGVTFLENIRHFLRPITFNLNTDASPMRVTLYASDISFLASLISPSLLPHAEATVAP